MHSRACRAAGCGVQFHRDPISSGRRLVAEPVALFHSLPRSLGILRSDSGLLSPQVQHIKRHIGVDDDPGGKAHSNYDGNPISDRGVWGFRGRAEIRQAVRYRPIGGIGRGDQQPSAGRLLFTRDPPRPYAGPVSGTSRMRARGWRLLIQEPSGVADFGSCVARPVGIEPRPACWCSGDRESSRPRDKRGDDRRSDR